MDKEEPYIMIKELIHQEDTSVITYKESQRKAAGRNFHYLF